MRGKVKVGKIELPCQCQSYFNRVVMLDGELFDLKHAVNWYFEMQSHPVPESCVNDNPHALKTWDEFRKMRESSKQQLIEMVKGE